MCKYTYAVYSLAVDTAMGSAQSAVLRACEHRLPQRLCLHLLTYSQARSRQSDVIGCLLDVDFNKFCCREFRMILSIEVM